MTTSEPRTPRGDTPREHRGLGQRILDAVLGDSADARPDDPADPRRGDPDRAEGRAGAEGFAGDGPRGGYSSYEQAMRDHPEGGAVQDDRTAGQGHVAPTRDAGPLPADAPGAGGQAGYPDRDDAVGDAGYDARDTVSGARREAGQAGYVDRDDARRDSGAAGFADRRDVGDTRRDSQAGYADQRAAGRADTAAAPWDSGYDQPGTRAETAPDAAHDLPRPGGGRAGDDRDLVTSSYDPDRDTGYDPQAAGTAMDPADGPVARNTNRDGDDDARATGYGDDRHGGGTRDYDPARDTGYVDAPRAEADRATGRRDADFDTGRVDAGRADLDRDAGDRVPTESVDRDRDDTHRGVGAAAGAVGAGAVAAAASRGDRSGTDRDLDRDARFSAVDDTATVDGTDTGRSAAGDGRAAAGVADKDGESGTRERLVPAGRAADYSSRWDALKGDFVDEPRRAVRQADELVGELLDELQRLFGDQRRNLEQGFDHDRASTEDLRLALRRYRSFFDRLLSF